tara:strand:- start:235 stop:624 length:390 start_codon:yes stop_codon:yes gene_type:complete
MHWNTLKLSKSLIVNADEILEVHPQIEVKVHHIINVWENDNDKIESSVEMVDYTLHSFMGEPLLLLEKDKNQYGMFKRYRAIIEDLGIDLDGLVDNAAVGSIPAALVNQLENDYQMMLENNADPIKTMA